MDEKDFELVRIGAVKRYRLIILVIVGRRADLHCLRSVVGMGSSSEEESDELVMRVEISSIVAG